MTYVFYKKLIVVEAGRLLGAHRTPPGKRPVGTEINPRYSEEPY
ncbi:hypothetical protein [Lysinibacillus sp. NPDC056232]